MGPPWKAAAVSVVGTGHLEHGQACGDASSAVWNDELQTLVLVAADGAGEAKQAALGSARAVEAVTQRAPSLLKRHRAQLENPERLQELLIELARDTRAQLEREAQRAAERLAGEPVAGEVEPSSLHDYATTLLVAIHTPEHLATLQVGDGFIVVTTNRPDMTAVFRPSKGEFANQTWFLTSFDSFAELAANRQVQVNVQPGAGVSGVALITDGLENVAMNMRGGGTPHPPFFLDLMRKLLELELEDYRKKLMAFLLDSERIKAKTDDDKTLVLAVNTRNPPELTPERYPQTPSGPPDSSASSSGTAPPRKGPPKPKVIDLSGTEADEERAGTTESTGRSLPDVAAAPTPQPPPPAATSATRLHTRGAFLKGFLAALALVAVAVGVYLFVPGVRTRVSQPADVVPAGTTEVVLELCLAVTASQFEAGRSRPESELGELVGEFGAAFDPQGGPFCLPRSGGAFREEAVRIQVVTLAADGGTDTSFISEGDYTVTPKILPDRRIYTYALATLPTDGSLQYAFDVTLASGFIRCDEAGGPVIAAAENLANREVFFVCLAPSDADTAPELERPEDRP